MMSVAEYVYNLIDKVVVVVVVVVEVVVGASCTKKAYTQAGWRLSNKTYIIITHTGQKL